MNFMKCDKCGETQIVSSLSLPTRSAEDIIYGVPRPDWICDECKGIAKVIKPVVAKAEPKEKYNPYTRCEKCDTRLLKGDIMTMTNGDEVCEYCSDSYDSDQRGDY